MRVHVLSDLHIEFGLYSPAAIDADVIVLAGDSGLGRSGIRRLLHELPPLPLLFVAGNHEYYGSSIEAIQQELRAAEALAPGRVFFLDQQAIELNGVRFLGCTLWSDFCLLGSDLQAQAMDHAQYSMNDYYTISCRNGQRKHKLTPQDTLNMHLRQRHWLQEELAKPFAGDTVVITHHAPHPDSLALDEHDGLLCSAYCSDLSDLMGKAKLWIHGHIHRSNDYCIKGTRIVSNPRGYHPNQLNPEFDPGLVVQLVNKNCFYPDSQALQTSV